MSYHILHVSDYGCRLFKERGLLVCERGGSIIGKIALEDLRAVILLNEAVSISGAVISDLSGRDAVIIHCKNFKPVGITIPNSRTYDSKVVLNQAAGNGNLNAAIWRRLLRAKIENNASCLENMGVGGSRISKMFAAASSDLNESWFAREYWKYYFPLLGEYGQRRNPKDESSRVNQLLNYGYGIMGGMVHRSIIVSGLNYLLGVNHKTYYKSTPLVYDIMEPFRAFVDFALYKYMLANTEANMRSWYVYFGRFLSAMRVRKGVNSVKLLDAPDILCRSLANVYRNKKADDLWVPRLK